MSQQVDHFANDLDAMVDRYRAEYDLTYADVIGALTIKIHLLCMEADEREDEV